jgi:hypothetical protein
MYLCTCFRDIVSSALSSSLDAPMACTYVHALGVLFHRLFRARWGHPMSYIFYTRFRVWIHFVAECDSSPRGELLTERLRAPEEWLYLQWLFATFQSSHPRNGSMKVVRPPPWSQGAGEARVAAAVRACAAVRGGRSACARVVKRVCARVCVVCGVCVVCLWCV